MKYLRPTIAIGVLLAAYLATQTTSGLFFVAASLWLLGPGYLVERYLRPAVGIRPLLVRVTLWLEVSLGIVPLIYLWMTTLHLALHPPALFVATALLVGGCTYYGWRDLAQLELPHRPAQWVMPLLLLETLVLTGWKRLNEIDGLAFPPWVDSVHHALMIRVVWETGRAPFSLVPYLPINHFAYHWGYHAIAATLLHLTGLSLPVLMLWFGQLLATLYVVVLGGAAYALWRHPLAAIVAGGIAGLVSLMPAYYLSWGRYTLLAGLLLVPGVMIVSMEVLQGRDWRSLILLTLLLAGLNTIHFVAFSFALVWCAAAWLLQPGGVRQLWSTLQRFVMVGVLVLFLTAPWISFLIHQTIATTSANSPLSIVGGDYNGMPLDLLWVPGNRTLVLAALVAAYLGLRHRSRATLLVIGWVFLVLCCANPVWFGLPYLSFFTNRIVVIAIVLPLSLLLAGGAVTLDELIVRWLDRTQSETTLPRPDADPTSTPPHVTTRHWSSGWTVVRTLAIAAALLWSARYLLPRDLVLNQGLVFAQPADLAAITWAAEHTPPNARFAINTEGWLYDVNRGSDGGWWLLPLAGRQVSTPPVIFTYGDGPYVKGVKRLTATLRDAAGKSPEELAAWMQREHFGYAYATQGGRIFDRDRLRGSPLFEELYRNDTISIFQRKS